MTQDIVVTIIHRNKTGQEDLIRLRSRINGDGVAPPPDDTNAQQGLAPELKALVLKHIVQNDTEGTLREKTAGNPDVCQQAGNIILRPLQAKARKIPTGLPVTGLPGGLSDAVPPLTFTRHTNLSLDSVSEALVCFGVKRSEAQFLVLYVSDIVDEAEASASPRSMSVSLDTMNVVARIERTGEKDTHPNQLRVLIVIADHASAPRPGASARTDTA
jgi:hypothetical protein